MSNASSKKLWPLQIFMLTCSVGYLRRANWPCPFFYMFIRKDKVLSGRRCGKCRSCKDRKKTRGKL